VDGARSAIHLLVITDWTLGEDRMLGVLERVVALGPRVALQHRHPGAPTRTFLAQARTLAALCGRRGNPLFVNGRLDVALLVGAHLHLPVEAPTPAQVRAHLPPRRWVSASVHDGAELERARGADLVLLSPVFPPGSKPTDPRPTLGPAGYARLRALAGCPALALGGMTVERLGGLGAVDGVAAQSAVLRAEDPLSVASALLARLPQAG
jgi:thiamine-phosphate pyrophosphorylase